MLFYRRFIVKKCLFALVVLALFGGICSASLMADEVILKADSPAVWTFSRGRVLSNSEGVITTSLPCAAVLKADKAVKIEAGKVYTLRGEFRYIGGDKLKSPCWIGFTAYTADGKMINRENVNRCFPRILGEVVTAAGKDATEIEVKGNLAVWQKRISPRTAHHYRVNCDVKPDGSDMPNFKITPGIKANGITKLENGNWKIEFIKPVGIEFSVGSKVAMQYIGMTYQFVERGKLFGNEWTSFQGSYSTEAEEYVSPFYPKQAAAGIAFFCSHRGGKLEFRNIEIICSDN